MSTSWNDTFSVSPVVTVAVRNRTFPSVPVLGARKTQPIFSPDASIRRLPFEFAKLSGFGMNMPPPNDVSAMGSVRCDEVQADCDGVAGHCQQFGLHPLEQLDDRFDVIGGTVLANEDGPVGRCHAAE
jgi:hypothetical protein